MVTSAAPRAIKSVVDGEKRAAIIETISSYDLPSSGSWDVLNQLPNRTEFEGIDAVPDGIFEVSKDDFEAVATVYITLRYGNTNDQSSMSDSYPVHVEGTYDPSAGVAKITEVSIDTSSFYS